MDYRILGPLEVVDDGRQLALGGTRQRALLAILLLHANEVVSTDHLVEELWGENPPESGPKALQVAISQLRKTLRSTAAPDGVLLTRTPGYVLSVRPGELDLDRFEALVAEAEESRDARETATLLREALALWRGPPLGDLAYESFAGPVIGRLEAGRLAALEDRIDADLALGRQAGLVGELEELVAAHPRRERLRGQLMLALYRSGRQAEALEAYQHARRALVDELGIEPSPELQKLQREILEHDPALGAPAEERKPAAAAQALEPRRKRILALLGLVVLAAAALAAVILTRGGDGGSVAVPPNSVAVIDPESNEVVDAISVGESPGPIVAQGTAIWVLNLNDKTLSRIDGLERTVADTLAVGPEPVGMAAAPGDVWIFNQCYTPLLRVDPGAARVVQTVQLPKDGPPSVYAGCGVAAEADSVWVTKASSPEGLFRIAVASDRPAVVAEAVRLPVGPSAVAIGEASVWASDAVDDVVRRIDPTTLTVVRSIPVGNKPVALAVGAGSVWVVNADEGSVSQIRPRTNTVVKAISVGAAPTAVSVGAGAVWVANSGDGTVSRIDPETYAVTTVEVGHRPLGVAVGNGLVWVTVRS